MKEESLWSLLLCHTVQSSSCLLPRGRATDSEQFGSGGGGGEGNKAGRHLLLLLVQQQLASAVRRPASHLYSGAEQLSQQRV